MSMLENEHNEDKNETHHHQNEVENKRNIIISVSVPCGSFIHIRKKDIRPDPMMCIAHEEIKTQVSSQQDIAQDGDNFITDLETTSDESSTPASITNNNG